MCINQREGRETPTHPDRTSQKLVGAADDICMRSFNIIFPYIPRSKTSLPYRFLTKIYYTYRICYMRLQSAPVFSFGKLYFWLEEKPIQRLPRNNFGYHVTCHFSARMSAVLATNEIWTYVWNSCLSACILSSGFAVNTN